MDSDDIKRMIAAFVLCMAIIIGWQYYQAKIAPPAQPPQTQKPAPQSPSPSAPQLPSTSSPSLTTPEKSAYRLQQVVPSTEPIEIGSKTHVEGGYKSLITLDPQSAAVRTVLLSEHKHKVTDKETGYPLLLPAVDNNGRSITSFMLGILSLQIDGLPLSFDLSQSCWRLSDLPLEASTPPGEMTVQFTATILDSKNAPVLDIIKTYHYGLETYDLNYQLQFVNRSILPIQVNSLEVFGPTGTLREDPRSDQRNVTLAFQDPKGQIDVERKMLIKVIEEGEKSYPTVLEKPPASTFQWFAVASKFFTVIVKPLPAANAQMVDYLSQGQVTALPLTLGAGTKEEPQFSALGTLVVLAMETPLPAGADAAYDLQIYLGAIDKRIFDQNPNYIASHYEHLLYQGGCSFCAFDWITYALLKIITFFYLIIRNYGVAIILLVLLVRLVLHPITKKSQVNMMGMQKMGPQMEEIKRKYANDKQELNRRTMEIYKKQGLTPILGCLPMLLQMPIWIGLYTAVNMNVALRHKGLFPASWHWLNDLSAPDRLIPFEWFGASPITVPLVGSLDAFNLLPVLLCIAMFLQQKLMSKATPSTNPQAAQQQKMMLVMMPIMMLVFLYTAPSGLNLYIMASTFGGLIEQKVIRKHIEEKEAAEKVNTTAVTFKIAGKIGPKLKKPKPPRKFF